MAMADTSVAIDRLKTIGRKQEDERSTHPLAKYSTFMKQQQSQFISNLGLFNYQAGLELSERKRNSYKQCM